MEEGRLVECGADTASAERLSRALHQSLLTLNTGPAGRESGLSLVTSQEDSYAALEVAVRTQDASLYRTSNEQPTIRPQVTGVGTI
ncbi:hypothetical protein RRG08_035895 [Elysia crispata]|uniref:Uncharacterized protein n=1 Tax=Elysia crispata TaxID=231223 RepID=A0AAE1A3U9_9GAST|nr:hypothetical protein RRG08_035895 [Elysia crispata]